MMVLTMVFPLFLFLSLVDASLPLVDFDRMGKVGIAGAFAGLDLFSNATAAFDPTTSSLFVRASNGSLQRLASSNSGGRISAGCSLSDVFYFAGSFSSIAGTPASNIASYTPSSGAFAALGTNGPNGEVDAVYCDTKNTKLWVGGSFTSPGTSVAIWDPKASSWSAPPFKGLAGAEGKVLSITTNSSDSSLFFAGSFITSFVGNGSTVLNDTNNPNVPFSAGATPFTSSLVPVPIPASAITGSPSSTDAGFSNASNILCPAGPDGAGNTWLGANANTAELTVRPFTFMTVSGVRLGNTFQPNHGTTGFVVTTIPDNTVQTLSYFDPTTNQNETCSNPCPLLTDPSILYQDFLFRSGSQSITGVQIQLTEFTGAGPGLHILQLLSSGAFASSVRSQNGPSCFSFVPSNTSLTGTWVEKDVFTDIPGTQVKVLTSSVDVGTPSGKAPTFTWNPYVSASGDYTMNILIPGCTQLQDCALRTSVKVTVFPGDKLDPWVTNVTQQNTDDSSTVIYQGPILPTSPDFLTTVTMSLADDPAGTGQNGKWELVADRIQLVLNSVNATTGGSTNGSSSNGTSATRNSFGFFEWPLAATANIDGTATLANTTETALDAIGLDLFTAVGGSSLTSSSTTAVAAVAHHPSSVIFLGGDFSLSSGGASGSDNVVSFKDGALVTLAGNGLNGPVTSFVLDGDSLFVGGSFTNTKSASNGQLRGVASYNVQTNQWTPLNGGVDGDVSSLSFVDGQLQVAGNFTSLLSPAGTPGAEAAGFAAWDVASSQWVNSGGFVVGSMTLVVNGTSNDAQFVAGNVQASQPFGASGMVMLQNSKGDIPSVAPLGVALEADVSSAANQNAPSSRKRSHSHRASTWLSHVKLPILFSRQTSTLAALPAALPAPAPAVLAGAFWTNSSSSAELAVIGGNFSFFPSGSNAEAQGVAIYDPDTATSIPLKGAQVNGTVRTLLVVDDVLYVGGEFTISGMNANGFAIYDLAAQQWDTSNIQALQGSSGSPVVVRSITASTSKTNTVIVAGTFAQAGSLLCRAVCSLDTTSNQWNALGSGIQGEVASVAYAGSNQEFLIASGSIALSDSTPANVAQFTFSNASWVPLGSASDLPGPVTAVEVNAGNSSSIFAAGRSTDASSSFLSFWNGISWTALSSTLESNTTVAQLTMVPLQDTHSANSIIQSDRMLMISGSLADPSFGNASSALFDGQSFFPYIVSTSSTGSSGTVSSLFRSFASFSFTQHHFLATGIVILISIAIAAGVVFLLALIGILWTLFSRRDDKLNKLDGVEEEDDDSTHHRPSSLLEHINAATRTTIIGTSPFAAFSSSKEDKQRDTGSPTPDQDPFAPDASNYMRAETPSDAIGGVMTEEMSRPAQARYSFDGTGEGELPISAGSAVEVLDDRDPAWWYARDPQTGQEGVVPAAYLF
ncbi:cortical protein marker for cell polarity-domain-containing protein [Roridomyces roridus]|uniref:Cortical protein marker for cell polarity-domain-containing protein n=1 Tax=Roridomyces roridus TaxID=1738132 RepID=A0AAD7G0L7_9AGAR|nr:cortical protein marker for cell polarity-domain-containing protein [Roridomyces roridus]